MKRNTTIRKVLKVLSFILIFTVIFLSVQSLLVGDSDTRDKKRIAGFFELPEKSLDAVFLGSSATYTFWNPPVAWAEYGITVYPLSNSAQPTFAAKYLIEDARKSHPDALYIVNISHILEDYETYLDKLLINYPLSINKLKMANYLYEQAGYSFAEKVEMFFPIIRYHERWSELTYSDFVMSSDPYMAGSHYNVFLNQSKDATDYKLDFSTRIELAEYVKNGMNDLMAYCEQENIKVLFVVMPQSVEETRIARQNTLVEMIENRGLDVLDLRKHIDEIGLDLRVDYYNGRHTNIHGSLKVTKFFSEYLIENYGFTDKRGEESYSDWDIAADKYYNLIKNYLLPGDFKYLENGYNK